MAEWAARLKYDPVKPLIESDSENSKSREMRLWVTLAIFMSIKRYCDSK